MNSACYALLTIRAQNRRGGVGACQRGACSRKLNRDDSWPSRFAASIAALARTQKESRDEAHPADPVPPPDPEARRRQRPDGAGQPCDAAHFARRRPPAGDARPAVGRHRRQPRGDLGARRPAGARGVRGRDQRRLPRRAHAALRRRAAGERLCREAGRRGSARRPGHLLSRDLLRSHRRQRGVGAGERPLPHRARRSARRLLHLVRRHRGAGLGHRREPRRHEGLCHHAQPPARFLHSLRRHRLCRRRAEGRGRPARRHQVEEPDDRREGQGRRDPGRVPRPVQIQPDGQARPRLQRPGADAGAVGRPRGHQQLVGFQAVRRALHREERAPAGGARRPRVPRIRADCAVRVGAGPGLPQGARTARCSTCSSSTCGAIAARTATTWRARPAPTRCSSAATRSSG